MAIRTENQREEIMSYIIGANNNPYVNFTLSPGHSTRIWWYGYGKDGVSYNVGFAFPTAFWEAQGNRVVVDNNAMQWAKQDPNGNPIGGGHTFYTADLHAENTSNMGPALFRFQIGELS
jgi:hypothetical protein